MDLCGLFGIALYMPDEFQMRIKISLEVKNWFFSKPFFLIVIKISAWIIGKKNLSKITNDYLSSKQNYLRLKKSKQLKTTIYNATIYKWTILGWFKIGIRKEELCK